MAVAGDLAHVAGGYSYPEEDPAGVPTPYEISDIFVYLASDASVDVTGQRFRARDFEWPEADVAP